MDLGDQRVALSMARDLGEDQNDVDVRVVGPKVLDSAEVEFAFRCQADGVSRRVQGRCDPIRVLQKPFESLMNSGGSAAGQARVGHEKDLEGL